MRCPSCERSALVTVARRRVARIRRAWVQICERGFQGSKRLCSPSNSSFAVAVEPFFELNRRGRVVPFCMLSARAPPHLKTRSSTASSLRLPNRTPAPPPFSSMKTMPSPLECIGDLLSGIGALQERRLAIRGGLGPACPRSANNGHPDWTAYELTDFRIGLRETTPCSLSQPRAAAGTLFSSAGKPGARRSVFSTSSSSFTTIVDHAAFP